MNVISSSLFISRKVLGSKLVFITLKMSSEDKYQRLLNRHEGNEQFTDMLQVKH